MPERQKLKRASEAARDKAIELGATQSDIVEVVFGIADEEGILEDMFDVMDALESA